MHVDDNDDNCDATRTTSTVPVVHVVNSQNRIARVGGRHAHWVRTWNNRRATGAVHQQISDKNDNIQEKQMKIYQ